MENKEEIKDLNQTERKEDLKKSKNLNIFDKEYWFPFQKIERNLLKCPQEKQAVAIISTGSLNPVHRMHIQMFQIAKDYLEKDPNFFVVGGFISPSHEEYVKSKLGMEYISANHRYIMCQLAVGTSDWLDVSSWEISQEYFVDFPQVAQTFQSQLDSAFPQEKFTKETLLTNNETLKKSSPLLGKHRVLLFYLCGGDHAIKCRLTKGLRFSSETIPVVCVSRPTYGEKLLALQRDNQYFFLAPLSTQILDDVSSTQIRKRLRQKQEIESLTGSEVAQYISKYKILN